MSREQQAHERPTCSRFQGWCWIINSVTYSTVFAQVFSSYHSKAQAESTGPPRNPPTCVAAHPHCWSQPLSKPSTSSRGGRQIPREWQPPGTCRGREPASTATGSPEKKPLLRVSTKGLLERAKHPGHSSVVAFPRAGGLSPRTPSLPRALLTFTRPTLSPQKPAGGHGPTPAP